MSMFLGCVVLLNLVFNMIKLWRADGADGVSFSVCFLLVSFIALLRS